MDHGRVKNASHGAVVPVVFLMAARPVLDPDRSADVPGTGKAGASAAGLPERRHRADAPATVVLVDDHAGFRREARALLELDGLCVVGEAADGTAALAAVARLGQPSSSSTWVCPTSPVSTWSKRSDVWSPT